MKCPKDGCNTVIMEAEGHIGFVCGSCHGMWLPERYLDTLCLHHGIDLRSFLDAFTPIEKSCSVLSCTQCSSHMSHVNYAGMQLDFCGDCHSMWLDTGQLLRLQNAMSLDHEFVRIGIPNIGEAFRNVFKDLTKVRMRRA